MQADTQYQENSPPNPPRSLKTALDAVAGEKHSSNDTASETSEEDYDTLRHDPATVVGGGKGGGYTEDEKSRINTSESGSRDIVNGNGYKSYESLKGPSRTRPNTPRLKSIPVTLNKLKEKGKYILTADDEALKEILKTGLERVCVTSLVVMLKC